MSIAIDQHVEVQLLAVDLDDITIGRLNAVVQGTELRVVPVSWNDVVRCAGAADGPIVVLLEWSGADEEECNHLCASIRYASRAVSCHIVALGGIADQDTLARAVEGQVDDVLSRPFGNDLAFRLRRGVRNLQPPTTVVSPRRALEEALAHAAGGDVVVRAGDVTAIIHVQDGFIVWANVSSLPTSIEEVVGQVGVRLEPDVVVAVKEECQSSSANFMDVLVQWKVIEREQAREAVRLFIANRLHVALDLPAASALFLPKRRPITERMAFRASEIGDLHPSPSSRPPSSTRLDGGPRSSRSPMSLTLDEVAGVARAAAQLEGAVGAAVLDRRTGASLAQAGAEMNTTVAWAQLATLSGLGGEAGDVMACAGERCFVTRPLSAEPSLALFVIVSLSVTNAGMARAGVARLADARSAPRGS